MTGNLHDTVQQRLTTAAWLVALSIAAFAAGCGAKSDPCATSNGGCDQNAACTSTAGKVACACKPGYTGTGQSCTGIDECSMAMGGCDKNATCTNVGPGANACTCNSGYSGDGHTCAAVNNCLKDNGGCDANALCSSIGPGESTCACKGGYSGDGHTCAPVNSCETQNGNCDPNATCTSTGPGTNTCTCNTGYSGDGAICSPVNSCLTNNGGCDPNATCTSTGPGTNTCTCNTGYATASADDGGTADDAGAVADGGSAMVCVAVNSCLTNNGGCDVNATCTSTGPGTNSCACNNGYQDTATDGGTSGLICLPINPCDTNNGGCDTNATCTPTGPDSSTCACNLGYDGDGMTCTPIDNCASGKGGCDPHATCTTTGPGTNTCSCIEPLVGTGQVCMKPGGLLINDGATTTNSVDVKLQLQPPGELAANGDLSSGDLTGWSKPLNGGNGAVVVLPGLFSGSAWLTSYGWDERAQEIDLLAAGYTAGQLDSATPPAFTVLDWASGSWPNYNDRFLLHAELRDANHQSLVAQDDGTTGAPVILSNGWTPRALAFSGYPAGARYLYVEDGAVDSEYWAGNYGGRMANLFVGSTDQLQVSISNDGQTWTAPQPWTPEVSWTLNVSGKAFVLVRYLDAQGGIVQTAAATIGYCPSGYVFQHETCVDDQMCEDGAATCDPHATCADVPGNYTCTCNTGYSGDGKTCSPINACASPGACDPNATCTDTGPGTYTCACKAGYVGDGKSCVLANPCSARPGPCDPNATCANPVAGQYSCRCNAGYYGNGAKCIIANPCLQAGTCGWNAICTNTAPGAATCSCRPGFTGDGHTCTPIDNCASIPNVCSPFATCIDTGPGTNVCQCHTGYTAQTGNACDTPGELLVDLNNSTTSSTSVELRALPPGNLLVNSDNTGTGGWTDSPQNHLLPWGGAPVPNGPFSGTGWVTAYPQWQVRSQTVDLQAFGFNSSYISARHPTFILEDFVRGTAPIAPPPAFFHDPFYVLLQVQDASHNVISTQSIGTPSQPHTSPDAGKWTIALMYQQITNPTARYIYLEEGGSAYEPWTGERVGAAFANAYLGLNNVTEEFSNDLVNWSSPASWNNFVNWMLPGAVGEQTVYARFSTDNGATWMTPVKASVNCPSGQTFSYGQCH